VLWVLLVLEEAKICTVNCTEARGGGEHCRSLLDKRSFPDA
jgi:hypothetical protein